MKRIAVLTSGGDAPGMNAAVRSVVRTAIDNGMMVFGIKKGFEGLIEDDIMRLGRKDVGGIIYKGGTFLFSARSERFLEDEWIDVAAENLKKRGIEGLVVIGGDGTYRGAIRLAERGIAVAGVPGTIDNDLGYTDYTIGFDTAVNTNLDLINKIRDTSSSHERTTIIEVMGRKCGDIALYSGLAGGAEITMVPENEMPQNDIVEKVQKAWGEGKRHVVIVKAEGTELSLEGLQSLLENETGRKTCSVIPGYIQRGGSPTVNDRLIASLMGSYAVNLLKGKAEDRPCDAFAVGIHADKCFAITLEAAIAAKRPFRYDIYKLANILG